MTRVKETDPLFPLIRKQTSGMSSGSFKSTENTFQWISLSMSIVYLNFGGFSSEFDAITLFLKTSEGTGPDTNL